MLDQILEEAEEIAKREENPPPARADETAAASTPAGTEAGPATEAALAGGQGRPPNQADERAEQHGATNGSCFVAPAETEPERREKLAAGRNRTGVTPIRAASSGGIGRTGVPPVVRSDDRRDADSSGV